MRSSRGGGRLHRKSPPWTQLSKYTEDDAQQGIHVGKLPPQASSGSCRIQTAFFPLQAMGQEPQAPLHRTNTGLHQLPPFYRGFDSVENRVPAKVGNPPTAADFLTIKDGPQSTLSGHSARRIYCADQ
jgi:hypothetical protein